VCRLARILVLAAVTLCVTAPAASALPTKKLADTLGALWTTVLQTPLAQNSYGGPASGCWDLDGTLAPLGPNGVEACTVKPGTKIYLTAATWECSTFPGDHPDFGTTASELQACALAHDAHVAPTITVDGRSVAVTEVQTRALNIVLPSDNILGAAAGQGQFAAHGWVVLLHPLTPGTHTIVIHNGAAPPITTTITVQPGR
jgi:hypothetical protein